MIPYIFIGRLRMTTDNIVFFKKNHKKPLLNLILLLGLKDVIVPVENSVILPNLR